MDEGARELGALSSRLDAVEAAMARLDAGTYGRCEGCEAGLGELLAVDPTARRCEACATVQASAFPTADDEA
jgi:RNA polymerase-binding transcription factor DksA